MDKILFAITCTTCHAKLAVRSLEAIGTIQACPKCHSMVQVTPPPDWKPPQPEATTSSEKSPAASFDETPPVEEHASADLASTALFNPIWIVLGVAILIVFAAIGVVWTLLPETAISEPPKVDTPAVVTESTSLPAESSAETSNGPDEVSQENEPQASDSMSLEQPSSAGVEETKSEAAEAVPESKAVVAVQDEHVAPPDAEPAAPAIVAESAGDPIEIKKLPPVVVDVAARMADPLAGFKLADIPLCKALALLATMSGVPITMDVDAILRYGRTPRDPVSVSIEATDVGKALQAVAAADGLYVVIDSGSVTVTSPVEFRETLHETRYAVADLVGEDAKAVADLAVMIQKLIAPDAWQTSGGHGAIKTEPGVLIVEQSGHVQHQILVFCEKMRTARGKPTLSHDDTQQYSLATRPKKAEKVLQAPVTANFHQPMPLIRILEYLAQSADVDILIDHAALAAADTSAAVEASIAVVDRPLGPTLEELLKPLGLVYRVIDPHTLQITTREAADERLELEIYALKKDADAASIAEALKAGVAPATWSSAGGQAELFIDTPSNCLIILQSQAVHQAIEKELHHQ